MKPAGPYGTMPQEPWYSGEGVKPHIVIQLNCGEVCTHASCKTTKTSTTKEQKQSSFQINYDY